MPKKLIIIGMGGHSKVVTDVALRNNYEILGYLDDKKLEKPEWNYLGSIREITHLIDNDVEVFIAIGNNRIRSVIVDILYENKITYATLVDPSVIIGYGVHIEQGTLVMPGVIINADSTIGKHVIVNTGATVDHDCVLEDYVHISPGVHIAGGVHIGTESHLGIGCSIIPQVRIGKFSNIGAGAAVIKDVPSNTVAVGVPAKVIKKSNQT